MISYLHLAIAIVAEVIATSALKQCDSFRHLGPSILVVLGYGVAFYFLSLTLKTIPVGITYALWSGVGIVLITIVAWVAFQQRLDVAALAGIGLIVAGVIVISVFSKSVPH